MAEQWPTVLLGEIATVFDGPHATPKKTEDGPWYLSISSLQNGRVDLAESAHLSEADYPRWTKRVAPRPGDTLFSYETRLGEAGHWDSDKPAALGRRMGLLRPNPEVVEPRFLTYAYLGPQFQALIESRKVQGATVERILIAELPNWPVPLPSLDVQRRIAGVLGNLDDLIDTNQRLAENLRELAHLLYQDCVAGATETRALGDFLQLRYGKALPARARRDGAVPVVSSAGVVDSHDEALVSGPGIVVGRKGSVGTVTWVSADFFPIDTAFWVDTRESPLFVYFSLVNAGLEHMNTDSAVPGLNRENALSVEVPWPEDSSVKAFESSSRILWAAADELDIEATEARTTRDELLPLLMSGRVVPEEVA